jgi:hypothetical protein
MIHNFEAAEFGDTRVHMAVEERMLAKCSNWSRYAVSHPLDIFHRALGSAVAGSAGYRCSFGKCSCPHGVPHVDPFCLIEETRWEEWIGDLTKEGAHQLTACSRDTSPMRLRLDGMQEEMLIANDKGSLHA